MTSKEGLRVVVLQGELRVFDNLFSTSPLNFGRGRDNQIQLKYASVSRQHGRITIKDGAIFVQDLNSHLGIMVNGQKMATCSMGRKGMFGVDSLRFQVEIVKLNGQEHQPDVDIGEIASTPSESSVPPMWVDRFQVALDHQLLKEPNGRRSAQMLISWQGDLYDIYNYTANQDIRLKPKLFDEVSLPLLNAPLQVGRVTAEGIEAELSSTYTWSIERDGKPVTFKMLQDEKRVILRRKKLSTLLCQNELLSLDIGTGVKVHVRYIREQPPFIPRTWIENKEEFINAIQMSWAVHLTVLGLAMFLAPKSKGPDLPDVPPRFAKLLVEPPKQFMAPPPPPPPEVTPPTPPLPPKEIPKIVEEPKPPPMPKHKPKPKLHAKAPPPKLEPEPKVAEVKPEKQESVVPQRQAQTAKPSPEAIKAAQEAAAMKTLLASLPGDSAKGQAPPDLKLVKSAPSNKGPGFQVSEVVGQMQTRINNTPGTDDGAGKALASAVGSGFASTGGGKAGKYKIGGMVSVERPKLQHETNGLTDDEISKVVKAHLGEIQRCYERALFETPRLIGRVEYEWNIDPTGKVTSATVSRSEISNADFLNRCVIKVIEAMNFPAAKNNAPTVATIGFPFGRR